LFKNLAGPLTNESADAFSVEEVDQVSAAERVQRGTWQAVSELAAG
jgi:hypothetical protein